MLAMDCGQQFVLVMIVLGFLAMKVTKYAKESPQNAMSWASTIFGLFRRR